VSRVCIQDRERSEMTHDSDGESPWSRYPKYLYAFGDRPHPHLGRKNDGRLSKYSGIPQSPATELGMPRARRGHIVQASPSFRVMGTGNSFDLFNRNRVGTSNHSQGCMCSTRLMWQIMIRTTCPGVLRTPYLPEGLSQAG
jgi:hypothetical protein